MYVMKNKWNGRGAPSRVQDLKDSNVCTWTVTFSI